MRSAVTEPPAQEEPGLLAKRWRVNWELVLWLAIIGAGAGLRFWDLGSRAYHHDESLHATYSWYLYQGRGYEHLPLMHGPFQFYFTALTFFMFGDSDYTGRILPALFGTVLIGLPYFLRGHLGRTGALVAAVLIAFSPTLLYFSRFARNDIYVAVWALGLVICLWRYLDEGRHRYLYITALLLALMFATKEVSYIIVGTFLLYIDGLVALELWRRWRVGSGGPTSSDWLAFVPFAAFAWVIAALWPLLRRSRHPLAMTLTEGGLPRAGEMLIVYGLLTAPQLAALVQLPLSLLGMDINEAPEGYDLFGPWRTEQAVGLATVFVLIGATVAVGLAWRWRTWLIAMGIFYAAYVLLYTTFFTNMPGFTSGIWGSLDYWLAQQDVKRGGQPGFYYVVLLPVYEFLPLIFAGIAAAYFAIRGNAFSRFLVFWGLGAAIGLSYSGEKMPWLNVHLALPVALLAAYLLRRFWEERSADVRGWRLDIAVVAAVTTVVAGLGQAEGVAQIVRIGFVVVAAAVFLWLALPLRREALAPIAVAVVIGVLGVLSLRAAWMASFQHGDVPVEVLIYTQTSPDVPALMREIDGLAERSGQGKNMPILVDDAAQGFSWPWAWYLRNYRSVGYVNFGMQTSPPSAAVLLIGAGNTGQMQQYQDRYIEGPRYKHRWWFPEDYKTAGWDDFPGGVFKASSWRVWWRYFFDRKPPSQLGSVDGVIYFSRDYVTDAAAADGIGGSGTRP